MSHCTPQRQWWPQLLEGSPAQPSLWENGSLVLAGGQVGLPAGCAGLAPVSCLVNKVLFGINLADLSSWGFSCRVCWVHGRWRRRNVLEIPNAGVRAQLAAPWVQAGVASLWGGTAAWSPGPCLPACRTPRAAAGGGHVARGAGGGKQSGVDNAGRATRWGARRAGVPTVPRGTWGWGGHRGRVRGVLGRTRHTRGGGGGDPRWVHPLAGGGGGESLSCSGGGRREVPVAHPSRGSQGKGPSPPAPALPVAGAAIGPIPGGRRAARPGSGLGHQGELAARAAAPGPRHPNPPETPPNPAPRSQHPPPRTLHPATLTPRPAGNLRRGVRAAGGWAALAGGGEQCWGGWAGQKLRGGEGGRCTPSSVFADAPNLCHSSPGHAGGGGGGICRSPQCRPSVRPAATHQGADRHQGDSNSPTSTLGK